MRNLINKKGFTMVELLVAMAIIGLLIATAIWGIGTAQQSARNTQRRSMGANILAGLSEFYSRYNTQAAFVCGISGATGKIVIVGGTCTVPGSKTFEIPTNGTQSPKTTGALNVKPADANVYVGDAATSTYWVNPRYTNGSSTGYLVCAYLEGGGVANLSEPQVIGEGTNGCGN
jgi:prepilin-type N-terminal cleavage/methylation domain-containing protein